MDNDTVKIKAGDLAPGMGVKAIVQFSSEYSYLDEGTINFLKETFAGATVEVKRKGSVKEYPIVGLQMGDELTAIKDIPSALQFDSLDEDTTDQLQKRGFKEFLVASSSLPSGGEEAPPAQAPEVVAGSGGAKRAEQLAETKDFLEKVGEASQEREKSSQRVEEMFHQGRGGRYTTQPAMESVEDILSHDMSSAMTAVAGLRASDQTYAHCVDMAVIFHDSCVDILRGNHPTLPEKISRSTLAAGFMHDIGKSLVPKDILDSKARFPLDSKEMQLIRKHSEYGAKILSDAGMDEAMINVAHYHHVKKDTSLPNSYPDVAFSKVSPLTRLAAVVDVYQALIGKRSYKRNWVPGTAVQYLEDLKGKEFDDAMLDHFLNAIGRYPVGSLVKLSTGDKAFVIRIAGQDLDRPIVALVENSQGEILSQNTLVDLMAEQDIYIAEVVDHYAHYNEFDDQAFQIFSSINVV